MPKTKQKDDEGGIWLMIVGLLSAIGVGGAVLMNSNQSKKSTGTNSHSHATTTIQPPKKGCGCMKKH